MAKYSLPLSRLIGYEAIYYNLVFKDNVHAIRIYEKLGFRETGTLLFSPAAVHCVSVSYPIVGCSGVCF